jgi:hypothetical protein
MDRPPERVDPIDTYEEIGMSLQVLRTSFLALAVMAFGSDTVGAAAVSIDQRSAQAGKVTAGDAPGFPVTISEPGSYRLSSNLVVNEAGVTVIEITANDVTIDLAGFSIVGPNKCAGTPVECSIQGGGIGVKAVADAGPSPENVRVMNGTVRGMGGHGIRMMGNGTVVERVQAVSNGGPGIVVGMGSIIDSVATFNGAGAAVVGLIVRGTVAMNNVFGIFIRPGGVATGNSAIANAGTGLSVQCPAVVVGNSTSNNGTNVQLNGVCAVADHAQ